MLVSVKQLPYENIIVVTYESPFNPDHDINKAQEHIAAILEKCDGKMYRIDDLSEARMSWNQFVEGIFVATRHVPGSMTDPCINGILVGEDEMIKLAAESMEQEQYGNVETPMFNTLDEAIDYARQKLA